MRNFFAFVGRRFFLHPLILANWGEEVYKERNLVMKSMICSWNTPMAAASTRAAERTSMTSGNGRGFSSGLLRL